MTSGRFLYKRIKTVISATMNFGILRMELSVEKWYNEYSEKQFKCSVLSDNFLLKE